MKQRHVNNESVLAIFKQSPRRRRRLLGWYRHEKCGALKKFLLLCEAENLCFEYFIHFTCLQGANAREREREWKMKTKSTAQQKREVMVFAIASKSTKTISRKFTRLTLSLAGPSRIIIFTH